MLEKRAKSVITDRIKKYYNAVDNRGFSGNEQAALAMILVFLLQLLPIIFFFVAFMFIMANIMQIAIAILLIGVGIIAIRFALRGSSKFIKKLKGEGGTDVDVLGDYDWRHL